MDCATIHREGTVRLVVFIFFLQSVRALDWPCLAGFLRVTGEFRKVQPEDGWGINAGRSVAP